VDEEVAAEEGDEGAMDKRWQDAIAPRAKNQGKIGSVSTVSKVCVGVKLGL
jgi:hypothetical protein